MARMTREEVLARKITDLLSDRRINVHRLASHLLHQDPVVVGELVRSVSAMGDLLECGAVSRLNPTVIAAIRRMQM